MKNTIIKSSTINEYDKYDLMESPSIQSLKTLENREILKVSKWVQYESEDGLEILSIMDDMTGYCYSGQSKSFAEGFFEIINMLDSMEEAPSYFYIDVIKRRSKAGRDYLLCGLVSPERAEKLFGTPATEMPSPEK